jgi:dihydroxyacetone kinase-like predicted kinase
MLVFSGEDVGEGDAARLNETLAATYPNLEIMFNRGDQPLYDYVFVLC